MVSELLFRYPMDLKNSSRELNPSGSDWVT
jgi:hypothetical protein